MKQAVTENHARAAVVACGLLAVLIALAAWMDLGPFADEELGVAEFLALGDQICTEAHDEFLDLQQGRPSTPSYAAELTRRLIQVAEQERDAIADLEEPASLAKPLGEYLAAREHGIARLEDGLAAAERADASAYASLQAELAATQRDRFRLARGIGFAECSQPLDGRDDQL